MKIAFTVYNLAFVSNWIERLMPYWENCEIVIFPVSYTHLTLPTILRV